MNTTSVAALVTAVVGLSACAWTFVHGARQSRMTVCVLASIVVCLSLVFLSIGQGRLAALDAALVIGTLGPLVTVIVAVRGRGQNRALATSGPRPAGSQPPQPSAQPPVRQPVRHQTVARPGAPVHPGQPEARPGGAHGRRRHAR
ncbi:hypothetical protein [Yinghuangia sp. YIM S09857]|uniref:hypothetical protein n=1 Tax=Yinghuangia sp. YIM S09857 TaxID=3436929 RepID=UPI003F539CF5